MWILIPSPSAHDSSKLNVSTRRIAVFRRASLRKISVLTNRSLKYTFLFFSGHFRVRGELMGHYCLYVRRLSSGATREVRWHDPT